MKKALSILLVCVFTLSVLSGCNSDNSDKITVAVWLGLVNDFFGFEVYEQQEPYNSSVNPSSPYFADVQIAYEYSVLPEGFSSLKLNDRLTREFCALTLAGAIYIPNTNEVSIADIKKITHKEAVITVINEEIMALNGSNKFQPSKKLKLEQAAEYLEKAYSSWVNHEFETYINYTLADEVVDFSGLSTISQNEQGEYVYDDNFIAEQQRWLTTNDFSYNPVTETVTLRNIGEQGIEVGSVLTLPDSLEYPMGLYLKVESISQNDDGIYFLRTAEPELEELFEEDYIFQGTNELDFSNATFYDENGNILSSGNYSNNVSGYTLTNMAMQGSSYAPNMTMPSYGINNMSVLDSYGKFKLPELKISKLPPIQIEVEFQKDKIGIKAETRLDNGKGNIFNQKNDGNVEVNNLIGNYKGEFKAAVTYELNKFQTSHKIQNALKHNRLDVGYNRTVKGTFGYEDKSTFGGNSPEASIESGTGLLQSLKKQLGDYYNSDIDSQTAIKQWKLFTAVAPIAGPVSIELSFIASLTFEGSLEIVVEYTNCGFVIEKRKGFCLPNSNTKDLKKGPTSISGSAKAEFKMGLNVAACLAKINILDAETNGGIGVKGELQGAEVTNERYLLAREAIPKESFKALKNILPFLSDNSGNTVISCCEIIVYPIFEIKFVTGKSAIGKLFEGPTIKVLDDKSTPILKGHFESDMGFKNLGECTLKDHKDDGIVRGNGIGIAPIEDVILTVGEEYTMWVYMLPADENKIYVLEDLEHEVTDSSIIKAKADFKYDKKVKGANSIGNEIVLKALSPGETVVTIRTKDRLYNCKINVTVNERDYEPTLMLKTYSASVALNDTVNIPIDLVPNGKNELSVFWEIEDGGIATVDLNGNVTGVSEGVTTVYAYIPGYEDLRVACTIIVTKDYTSTNVAYGDNGDYPLERLVLAI